MIITESMNFRLRRWLSNLCCYDLTFTSVSSSMTFRFPASISHNVFSFRETQTCRDNTIQLSCYFPSSSSPEIGPRIRSRQNKLVCSWGLKIAATQRRKTFDIFQQDYTSNTCAFNCSGNMSNLTAGYGSKTCGDKSRWILGKQKDGDEVGGRSAHLTDHAGTCR